VSDKKCVINRVGLWAKKQRQISRRKKGANQPKPTKDALLPQENLNLPHTTTQQGAKLLCNQPTHIQTPVDQHCHFAAPMAGFSLLPPPNCTFFWSCPSEHCVEQKHFDRSQQLPSQHSHALAGQKAMK